MLYMLILHANMTAKIYLKLRIHINPPSKVPCYSHPRKNWIKT